LARLTVECGIGERDRRCSGKNGRPNVLADTGDQHKNKSRTAAVRQPMIADCRIGPRAAEAGRAQAMQSGRFSNSESGMVVQEMPNGFSVTLPPQGLVRGSHGLFVFAIIWDAVCSALFVAMIIARQHMTKGPPLAPFLLFIVIFFGVGALILLTAVNMGTRRAMIGLVGDIFAIRRTGLFGAREWRWNRTDISQIAVGPSGIKVNNRDVPELQITDRGGRTSGFFSERSEAELQQLAAFLRDKLGLAASPFPDSRR